MPRPTELLPPHPEAAESLDRYKDGRARPTLSNLDLILSGDPSFRDRLYFDEFRQRPTIDGVPSTDAAEHGLRLELERRYRIETTDKKFSAALEYHVVLCREHRHEVRDWLDALDWDGAERLDTWLIRCAHAQDSPYVRAVSSKVLIGAVARVRQPGCKLDTLPVLVGPQGCRKSSLVRLLAGDDWFADSDFSLATKDRYMHMSGAWLIELQELNVLKGRHADGMKAFLSSGTDRFRPPFGRNMKRVPRQSIVVGTTNSRGFLKDPTGSRRFWPVEVDAIDLDLVAAERSQLWAEAVHRYEAGEPWWLDHIAEADRARLAKAYEYRDPWEEAVCRWAFGRTEPFEVASVLRLALDIPLKHQDKRSQNRVAAILVRAGFSKDREPCANVAVDGRKRRRMLWHHPAMT